MLKATPLGDVLQIMMCKYDEMAPGAVVCAYLADRLLIDTGPYHTAETLSSFLADKKLMYVVNTHHHEDHIAANRFLQDRFGVDIFAHPLAVDKIHQRPELFPYQEEVWGYPVPSVARPLGNTLQTENCHFEIIPTPGHDRDHICLFEAKKGWLFSGDLFLGTRPVSSRPMEDHWQTIEDLKKIRALKPEIMFSASGLVVSDPQPRLSKVISALEDMGAAIVKFHQQGMTPHQIMEKIFGQEAPIAARTQDQFSSENMVKCFLNPSKPTVS